MSRIKALRRIATGLMYLVLQIVIIPVLLVVASFAGLVSITQDLLGMDRRGRRIAGLTRWSRDALEWNNRNIHKAVIGGTIDVTPPR